MALSDFTPETEEVIVKRRKKGDMKFEVRGLSFLDVTKIVRVHYDDLEGLFDLYESTGATDLTYVSMGKFAMKLLNDAPGLVSHVIALAAGEEASLELAQSLPISSQLSAIQSIAKLTFSDIEDVKKMLAKVTDLMRDAKAERLHGNSANANAS